MTAAVTAHPDGRAAWTRPHLLGLEDLTAPEITAILDTARSLKEVSTR
jgi:aspartate carbamoyltransferase catalytic subunit